VETQQGLLNKMKEQSVEKNGLISKKGSLFFALFVLSAACFSYFTVWAQDSSSGSATGSFDIAKVRSAAFGTASAGQSQKPDLPKTPSISGIITRMVLSLGIILLLLAGIVIIFKKIFYRGKSSGFRSGALDVLKTTSIMPGKSLSLVRIADKVLLLGIFQEGIRCLSEFEGEHAIEIIQATDKGNLPRPVSQFSESLNIFLDKFKNK
jgi:flagellar protein FliO/FliZ